MSASEMERLGCGVCGRTVAEMGCRALKEAFLAKRWPLDETFCIRIDGKPKPDCYRVGYERLRAESTSLLERLRESQEREKELEGALRALKCHRSMIADPIGGAPLALRELREAINHAALSAQQPTPAEGGSQKGEP